MLFPLQLQQLAYLALICSLVISENLVNALPLRVRQNRATTVRTVHTTQTIAGQLTETCVITLTPITDKNGQPAVEEVKKCSISYDNPGGGGGGGGGGSSISTSVTTITTATTAGNTALPTVTGTLTGTSTTAESSPPATITSTGNNQTSITSASGPSSGTGSSTVPAVSTSTPSSASSSAPPVSGIHANGVSTVTGIPTPTPTSSTAGGSPKTTTTINTDTVLPDASASASAAAAQQPSQSSDAFQLPGKKLSVLPIGLGVFAGISVIALIVVGLVTYERTKYRKAFRQRKLAESGATMGYNGVA